MKNAGSEGSLYTKTRGLWGQPGDHLEVEARESKVLSTYFYVETSTKMAHQGTIRGRVYKERVSGGGSVVKISRQGLPHHVRKKRCKPKVEKTAAEMGGGETGGECATISLYPRRAENPGEGGYQVRGGAWKQKQTGRAGLQTQETGTESNSTTPPKEESLGS